MLEMLENNLYIYSTFSFNNENEIIDVSDYLHIYSIEKWTHRDYTGFKPCKIHVTRRNIHLHTSALHSRPFPFLTV